MNDQLTLLPDLSVAAADRPAPASKVKALAFSYLGDRGGINAYSDYAAKRKEQFLRDGCAWLKDVGQRLKPFGLTHVEVHANRAGIAVSGEVYAYFFPEGGAGIGLFLCLDESAMYRPAWFRERGDQLTLMARWRKRELEGKGRKARFKTIGQDGPNQWLDPSLDSRTLAEQLLVCFAAQLGIEPPIQEPAFFEGRL
jgi:hypothetical protein